MRQLTTEEFIEKSIKKHGNIYNYSEAFYIDRRSDIDIICPIHGLFRQQAGLHMYRSGCPKCANNVKYKFEDFVNKTKLVHGDTYQYINNKNFDNNLKVEIVCKKHGIFEQKAYLHSKGAGCPKCNIDNKTKTTVDFIEDAKLIHYNKYNYLKTLYKHSTEKVIITCKEHGDFKQTPANHLQGRGCNKCFRRSSNVEKEVLKYVKSITDNEVLSGDRKLIHPMEIDILIPSLKLAIEFNGKYWHYEKENGRRKHSLKSKLCKEKGYKLFHLREDLWKTKNDKMKEVIKTLIIK